MGITLLLTACDRTCPPYRNLCRAPRISAALAHAPGDPAATMDSGQRRGGPECTSPQPLRHLAPLRFAWIRPRRVDLQPSISGATGEE